MVNILLLFTCFFLSLHYHSTGVEGKKYLVEVPNKGCSKTLINGLCKSQSWFQPQTQDCIFIRIRRLWMQNMLIVQHFKALIFMSPHIQVLPQKVVKKLSSHANSNCMLIYIDDMKKDVPMDAGKDKDGKGSILITLLPTYGC